MQGAPPPAPPPHPQGGAPVVHRLPHCLPGAPKLAILNTCNKLADISHHLSFSFAEGINMLMITMQTSECVVLVDVDPEAGGEGGECQQLTKEQGGDLHGPSRHSALSTHSLDIRASNQG